MSENSNKDNNSSSSSSSRSSATVGEHQNDQDTEPKQTSSSSSSSSLFKKKIKNKPSLRKKDGDDESSLTNDTSSIASENGDDQQQDLSTIIEITKERQKMREKGKGIIAGVLAEGPHIKAHLRELEHKLDDSFTIATEKNETNVHLEKFLAKEMEKKKIEIKHKLTGGLMGTTEHRKEEDDENKQTKDNNANNTTTKIKTDEDSLYETPEHLAVKKTRKKEEDKTNWLAGISEVSLPTSYKIKNIQETEDARSKIKDSKRSHYQNNQNNNQQQQNNHGQQHRFTRQPNENRNEKATDDEVYERFKKRFRG
ncbi:hypothetical protein DFA_07299 [Cavenderia fasciculata]|uniref:Uncharacterized protein n=1 Tax=Cavenderia fasciculata TaxID=261658 RepID=F4PW15_CACFS|nr:uncharacterized protein DFA_07299 [Cavenderia fasciculata]EGG20179.1 hypothetical protein DFA_07299 [Cavenderia fasciculata]|eukprot:XP_004367162.1 hypothetical protein DFA_07299 [Cavenderia fasciculata]